MTTKGAGTAEHAVLPRAADALDAETQAIVERWLDRLPGVTPSLPREVCLRGMQDAAPGIVHGLAEALRAGRPEALDAAWSQPAREHARRRMEQGEALSDLLREFQVLRQEIWAALAARLRSVSQDDVYRLAGSLGAAIDTMITNSSATYGAELQRLNERAEQLRREAERRAAELDAVFHALPDLYFRLAADGTILDYQAGALESLYVPPEVFMGKRMADLLPPDVGQRVRDAIQAVLRTRALVTIEYALTVSGRQAAFEARLRPLGAEQVVMVVRDISERRQAEEERERLLSSERRAREEAQAALRSRDQFLGVAAHELKTPITSLRGYTELALKRMETGHIADPEDIRRAFETIDRQADRLSILGNQLLDMTALEAGELTLRRRETDLVALVRGLVETMQSTTTRHTLTLQAPASLVANVDRERLRLVIYNLIDNAIKYSPQGGPVQVELSAPDAGTARIAVRDYGLGIPPEQRPQLFTRFFKAGVQRPAGGLGVGLYVGQGLVEAHGGRIWAEFPEDGGSRFVVTLPSGVADARQDEADGAGPRYVQPGPLRRAQGRPFARGR